MYVLDLTVHMHVDCRRYEQAAMNGKQRPASYRELTRWTYNHARIRVSAKGLGGRGSLIENAGNWHSWISARQHLW